MLRVLLVLVLLAPLARASEGPALLSEALSKWVADEDYWAYTQDVRYRNGSKVETRVERFDPSQPDDHQWKLVLIDGKAPTASQARSWQKTKANEVRRRTRLPIASYFDFAGAKVVSETDSVVRYDVPLRKEAYRRLPLDKFTVAISVNKTRRELEEFSAGLLEDFRLGMGLAKVTDFGVDIRFGVVDPKYPPQPFSIKAAGKARFAFFFSRSGDVDVAWKNFQRVVPYNQRVSVEIGDLRALGF